MKTGTYIFENWNFIINPETSNMIRIIRKGKGTGI